MSEASIRTTVNGRSVEARIPTRMLLVEFLRERLGLTGTKVSCGMQVCGACTVLVDDRPVSACGFLACDADGADVVTVEGLARDGRLTPVQQAFVDCSALQCGFCTPGFVMMSTALLRSCPKPTEEQVSHYLEGNLCRCTGYEPIVEAVLHAAETLAEGQERSHDG
jgi:aerobic-type carbon monoxide dehydrogenase small subunit (CoxS/CutS family)